MDVQLGEDLSESLRGLQVRAICVLPVFLHAKGDPVSLMAPAAVVDSPKATCSGIGFSACSTAH